MSLFVSGTVSPATTTAQGTVQLAGDLGGVASAPVVLSATGAAGVFPVAAASMALGASPAPSGAFRMGNQQYITGRTSTAAAAQMLGLNANDLVQLGSGTLGTQIGAGFTTACNMQSQLDINDGASAYFFRVSTSGLTAGGIGLNAVQFGGGNGIISLFNANVVPNANHSLGVFVYSEGGIFKVRRTSGRIDQLGANAIVDSGSYENAGGWVSILTTTSAVFVTTVQTVSTAALQVGDVVMVSGRMNLSADASNTCEAEVFVSENGGAAVGKATTLTQLAAPVGVPLTVASPFHFRHVVATAGVVAITVQIRRQAGSGNVYLFGNGQITYHAIRP